MNQHRSNIDILSAIGIGLTVMILLSLTLPSHVADADNAEFMLIGLYGGIIHPPGYPLYVLCIRFFSLFVPLVDSPVMALSIFSALCVGGAATLYCRFLQRFEMPLWISLIATAWIFLSLPIWRMGNFVEPFGLHFLILVAVIYGTQSFILNEKRSTVLGIGVLWGFGLCNHHTLVFMIPMVLGMVALKKRSLFQWGHLAFLFILGFCIGLIPLIAFFDVSAQAPWVWGEWPSWERLYTHLLRMEYGTFQLVPDNASGGTLGWSAFFKSLPSGVGYIAVGLILVGVLAGWRGIESKERRAWLIAHLGCFLLYFVVFMGAMNVGTDDPHFTVIQRFLGQAYLLMAVFLALGLRVAHHYYGTVGNARAVPAAMVVCLLGHVSYVYPMAQRSEERFIQTHGENILSLSQRGDVLVVNNDLETFVLLYLNQLSDEPKILFSMPMYSMPWYQAHLAKALGIPLLQMPADAMTLLKGLQEKRRILLVDPHDLRAHPWVMERFFPLGPVWAIRPGAQEPPGPTELFKLNKDLYENSFILPLAEQAKSQQDSNLPKTRIEKELFNKYSVVWNVLCEALKTMRAGEMHEACSIMKQFQRIPPT